MFKLNYRLKHTLIFVGLSAVVLVGIVVARSKGIGLQDMLIYKPKYPALAALILIGAFCLKTVAFFIPVNSLYILAGLMFPKPWAIAVTLVGLICELSAGYFYGKNVGGDDIFAMVSKNKKVKKIIELSSEYSMGLCFVTRLFPIPMDLFNLYFGALKYKYWTYLLLSLLGLIPKMITYILMGSAASNIFSKEFLIPLSLCFGISAVLFVIFWVWQRYQTKRKGINAEN
jgi:uncharacterized membrane protein YdjX (TVP38/TMEM64 family)